MDRDNGPRVPGQRVPARQAPADGAATGPGRAVPDPPAHGDTAVTPPAGRTPGPVTTRTVADSVHTQPVAAPALRFSLLGPIRAWRDGEPIASGSPQQRAMLAALLLRDGRTATAAELIDALWGEEPPDRALATVRTYASRLRKVLGPDALVSEAGGYALRTGGAGVDLAQAQKLAAEADKARENGDLRRAGSLLGKSLGLWTGEPLASLPGPYAQTQRAWLEEWRLGLVETRLAVDLDLGLHAEAVSELTALTAAHPLRERLRELLMTALYRGGRQAEALAVYSDTRRLLAEELGVDPRPELTALQERILRADTELARPAQLPVPPRTVPRPAQLPAAVTDFTGRTACAKELAERLITAEAPVMAVAAVAGIGGVGKTTLAVHVAHLARPHFPDGQLYADLQGAGAHPSDPDAVLGAFLRALGIPSTAIPESPEERAALYRSTLDGRKVLVLLDNARDAAHVRQLLPGTAGCAALVTSRARMVGLAGAHLVDLDVLPPDEALELFTRIVGADRVGREREAALDVVAACGHLPLAIRIAASRLAARRSWTVGTLASKLADERRRLHELQVGDLAVEATFELGYGQLEPSQARAFRLLGLPDGPDISLPAAAALLDLPEDAAEDVLESLVDISLLEAPEPGRYRYQELVRLYARACAERDELPPAQRAAARSRLLDFYLATAARVYGLERPGDRTVDHLEPTESAGLAFGSRTEALNWLYSEAASILACVKQSLAHPGSLRKAVDLLLAAEDLAESGADARSYESAALTARDAATAAADIRSEGRARTALAQVYSTAGHFEEAEAEGARAMALGERAKDVWSVCNASNERGIVALCQGRYADAESHQRLAIEAFRADGNRPGEASALCNLGRALVAMDRTDQAVELIQEGMAIYDGMGLTLRLANARFALGIALAHAERHTEALEQFNEAVQVFEVNRQRLWQGTTYFRIAEVHLEAARHSQAAKFAEQSLTNGFIGGDWMRANILTVLGKALNALSQPERARACWTEALALYEATASDEAVEVRTLLNPLAA